MTKNPNRIFLENSDRNFHRNLKKNPWKNSKGSSFEASMESKTNFEFFFVETRLMKWFTPQGNLLDIFHSFNHFWFIPDVTMKINLVTVLINPDDLHHYGVRCTLHGCTSSVNQVNRTTGHNHVLVTWQQPIISIWDDSGHTSKFAPDLAPDYTERSMLSKNLSFMSNWWVRLFPNVLKNAL